MTQYNPDLKQLVRFGDTYLMNRLELNIKMWLDYGFLRSGAWSNLDGETLGAFGGDYQILRMIDDDSYTAGTVWESARKDWCWETGINHIDTDSVTQNPLSPAVIKVDGVVTAPDHINYPMGRVVFSSALTSSNVVTAAYSYRNIQTYLPSDVPFWRELQYRSYRVDDSHFSQLEDGSWAVGSQHRIQMPAIVIGCVPRAFSLGYQLGSSTVEVEQDVLCHVFAENRNDRNKLVDILRGQFDKKIWLFDNDAAALASDYPLDHEGDIIDASQHFSTLTAEAGHRWRRCHIIRSEVSEVIEPTSRLFEGVVRLTCEIRV